MKKFSKRDDIKERLEEPNLDIKIYLMDLMEEFLDINIEGPLVPEAVAATIKIKGKEELVEAIMDFMSSKEIQKSIETLNESSLTNNEMIIDKLKSRPQYKMSVKEIAMHRRRIKDLLNRYNNGDDIVYITEKALNSMKDKNKCYNRMLVAKEMVKECPKNEDELKYLYKQFEKKYLEISE